MQNRLTIIKYLLPLALLYSCSSRRQQTPATGTAQQAAYQLLLTQKSYTDSAWGYIIENNNRRIIQQFTIPALPGNKPFDNKQQAATIGSLVLTKLNNGERPTISITELQNAGIINTYNDKP
ncbi:MAG TPA: DUF4907 domain-containing protein [Ferruginibacter sp.]|nr:DUF4907 domain-containing protein [Ferruginibacter sp.]HMP21514.1 DUF4907 domain-containing protein [Ferruginibacter sp.]